mgnify:CR=1 FL=1
MSVAVRASCSACAALPCHQRELRQIAQHTGGEFFDAPTEDAFRAAVLGQVGESRLATAIDKAHKLVWTHKSGRKSLVIGCSASHIEGMDREEGQQLLQELLDWSTQPRFVYRHEWTPGDLLIWDNTGVLHRAEPYPLDCGRLMHRTTLLGEEPFA